MTTAYPGPLATNTFDRQTIDNIKRPNNKSEMLKLSQEPEHGTSPFSEDPKKTDQTQTDITIHGPPHYPMDPGHLTVPYNGPYSPDFLSTHHNIEDIFHLPVHSEKPVSIPKEKSKSKSDSKKPVESLKPHKETIDQYFPGPLAPDKFPDKATSMPTYSVNENQHVSGSLNPNKWASPQKDRPSNQAQFIPLHPQPDTTNSGFSFTPNNGENISPANKQYDNSAVGLPYQGSIPLKSDTIDPNIVVSTVPKKKTTPNNPFIAAEKSKPSSVLPDRPKQGQRNPDHLPEQLYHLINSQHPGLIQLNQTPPQSYPGLYELHQQISSQKQPSVNRVQQSSYFGTVPTAPKKPTKPHIFTQKDENGQTTYHIHTPDIPNTPQQIEELLAHINQHDSNPGFFQHYPGQPAVLHNVPNGPLSTLPLHIDAHIPHSGLTHLNHPLAAQTPSQSGSFLIIRRNNVQNLR